MNPIEFLLALLALICIYDWYFGGNQALQFVSVHVLLIVVILHLSQQARDCVNLLSASICHVGYPFIEQLRIRAHHLLDHIKSQEIAAPKEQLRLVLEGTVSLEEFSAKKAELLHLQKTSSQKITGLRAYLAEVETNLAEVNSKSPGRFEMLYNKAIDETRRWKAEYETSSTTSEYRALQVTLDSYRKACAEKNHEITSLKNDISKKAAHIAQLQDFPRKLHAEMSKKDAKIDELEAAAAECVRRSAWRPLQTLTGDRELHRYELVKELIHKMAESGGDQTTAATLFAYHLRDVGVGLADVGIDELAFNRYLNGVLSGQQGQLTGGFRGNSFPITGMKSSTIFDLYPLGPVPSAIASAPLSALPAAPLTAPPPTMYTRGLEPPHAPFLPQALQASQGGFPGASTAQVAPRRDAPTFPNPPAVPAASSPAPAPKKDGWELFKQGKQPVTFGVASVPKTHTTTFVPSGVPGRFGVSSQVKRSFEEEEDGDRDLRSSKDERAYRNRR